MSPQEIAVTVLAVVAVILAFVALIMAVLTSRSMRRTGASLEAAVRAAAERIGGAERWHDTPKAGEVQNRISETERRLTSLEARLENLPTKADLAEFRGEVRGEMKALDRDLKALDHQTRNNTSKLDSMQHFLMEQKS